MVQTYLFHRTVVDLAASPFFSLLKTLQMLLVMLPRNLKASISLWNTKYIYLICYNPCVNYYRNDNVFK